MAPKRRWDSVAPTPPIRWGRQLQKWRSLTAALSASARRISPHSRAPFDREGLYASNTVFATVERTGTGCCSRFRSLSSAIRAGSFRSGIDVTRAGSDDRRRSEEPRGINTLRRMTPRVDLKSARDVLIG